MICHSLCDIVQESGIGQKNPVQPVLLPTAAHQGLEHMPGILSVSAFCLASGRSALMAAEATILTEADRRLRSKSIQRLWLTSSHCNKAAGHLFFSPTIPIFCAPGCRPPRQFRLLFGCRVAHSLLPGGTSRAASTIRDHFQHVRICRKGLVQPPSSRQQRAESPRTATSSTVTQTSSGLVIISATHD
jgi:hypothetical protein